MWLVARDELKGLAAATGLIIAILILITRQTLHSRSLTA
jgi:hypothetical protein